MKSLKSFRLVVSVFLLLCSALLTTQRCAASVIGQWTFEGGSLLDSTGNFGGLLLEGNATIVNGELIVSRDAFASQIPSGWARTNGIYTGPQITSKTMVTWVTLTSLSNGQDFGSALTIDAINSDSFDAIVFSELEYNRWVAGSSNYSRTQNFAPGFEETTAGTRVQLAYTYEVNGADVTITGYREGILIGQYHVFGSAMISEVGDTEVIFGARHFTSGVAIGSLDARIDEARIYNRVLTQSEIANLTPVSSVPEPATMMVFCVGMGGFVLRRGSKFRIQRP